MKMSEKRESLLEITFNFITRRGYTKRWNTKPLTKCIMRSSNSGSDRAGFPHGGTLPVLCCDSLYKMAKEARSHITPLTGAVPEFSLDGKYWQRTNYEVNKFNRKNCLDIGVHHIVLKVQRFLDVYRLTKGLLNRKCKNYYPRSEMDFR